MSAPYTGIDNLEVMAGAVKYLRFLNGQIAAVAGPASARPRLLDFGAGAGTHAIDLSERGYPVDCLEIDPTLQDHLRQAGLTVFSDVAELEPASYDVAYTMNVLEHIDDDVAALRGLAGAIRPAGKLLVYVPALQVLYSAMDTKVGHLRRYKLGPLVDTVRRAGFEVDRCRYVDSLGFAATLAYKAIGSRKGDISTGSVSFYDRYGFPVSRGLDRVLDRAVGKNLLLVATRPAPAATGRP